MVGCLRALVEERIQPVWSAFSQAEARITGKVFVAKRSEDIQRIELRLFNRTKLTATATIESLGGGDPAEAGRKACRALVAESGR
jgi:hypothetical protein